MDAATLIALLKVIGPLGASLVTLLRTAGQPVEASAIESILARSEATARQIIATAQAELGRKETP